MTGWCVANKLINGGQFTIIWHVNNLKISDANPALVSQIIDLLSSEFGKEAPLTINWGKIHDYLGMTIEYSEDGKVKIIMDDYIKIFLPSFPRT
jgi:hypothetical protein